MEHARTVVIVALAFGAGALASHGLRAGERAELAGLGERMDELAARPVAASPDTVADLSGLTAALEDVHARLRSLETVPRRTAVREASAPPPREEESAATVVDGPAEVAAPRVGAPRWIEIEALLDGIVQRGWSFDGESGGMERYLELARDQGLIDELIAHREAGVDADPADTDARMALADSYVGKIMTLAGPEQGLWGAKAESQWKEVVALDEGHWGAHSSLGTNYAFYPDVMGKTDDAIHHLEAAREIQSWGESRPEHVATYLSLSRMYLRDGHRDEARAALEDGLLRHGGDESLMKALDRLVE
jgi:tetratricopeptide (TPR) repeat protein